MAVSPALTLTPGRVAQTVQISTWVGGIHPTSPSSPCPLDTLRLALSPAGPPQPILLLPSSLPGSCSNTLKQSKSNYYKQAALEHLLQPSPGIANAQRRALTGASHPESPDALCAPPAPPPLRGTASLCSQRCPHSCHLQQSVGKSSPHEVIHMEHHICRIFILTCQGLSGCRRRSASCPRQLEQAAERASWEVGRAAPAWPQLSCNCLFHSPAKGQTGARNPHGFSAEHVTQTDVGVSNKAKGGHADNAEEALAGSSCNTGLGKRRGPQGPGTWPRRRVSLGWKWV
jgi:hypothetical protein